MCLGQKSPDLAVNYLNAQLESLHQSSVACLERFGNLGLGERARHSGFALAEFYVGAKRRSNLKDMMFNAIFDKPTLEFICNHEAILYLRIKEGHFNKETAKADSSATNRNFKLDFKFEPDTVLAFRVKFNVQSENITTGNRSRVIKLVVLNFDNARLISKFDPNGREALVFYMRRYLDHLHRTGHDILFSIPDYDHPNKMIDYSLNSCIDRVFSTLDIEIGDVFGVSVEEINRTLSSKWLKSVMDAGAGPDPANRDLVCLAEYHSTWMATIAERSIQFHIEFGAPRIRVLCEREAALYFKIDKLRVYKGHDSTAVHTYSDWELAVVVNFTRKTEGSFKRIEIDMTTLRFCEHFSKFHGFDLALDFAATIKTMVVEFIEYHYTEHLKNIHFHVIDISRPLVTPGVDTSSSDVEEPSTDRPLPPDMIPMGPYDSVQIVSEQSINWYFKTLWTSSSEYSKPSGQRPPGDGFDTSVGALKIRYLSDKKAIVWVQIWVDEETLKPLKGPEQSSNPLDWTIAFEVKLEMVDQAELTSESSNRFREHSPEFVYELSEFDGLTLSNREAVQGVLGAVRYLENYLRELEQHGHHILQTEDQPPAHKPHQCYIPDLLQKVYDRHNCRHVSQHDIVLVLLGMTGFRPFPSGRLEYYTEWLARKKAITHGTVSLSRKVFLEECLLPLLAQVNAATTITIPFFSNRGTSGFVPLFTDHEGNEWGPALTTWTNNTRRPHGCDWERSSGVESDYEWNHYEWNHTDKWSYEHGGSIGDEHGTYTITCGQNRKSFAAPHTTNHGSDIIMGGEINIDLRSGGAPARLESKAVAEWSATLSMVSSQGRGLAIEVRGDTKPKFKISQGRGDAGHKQLIDPEALDKLVVIDLAPLVAELKDRFGGVWKHCFPGMQAYSLSNPVFNKSGDIFFSLQPCDGLPPKGQTFSKSQTPSSPATTFNGAFTSETWSAESGKQDPTPRRISEGNAYTGQSSDEDVSDNTPDSKRSTPGSTNTSMATRTDSDHFFFESTTRKLGTKPEFKSVKE
ncbi:hypothetical protein BD779DRAFT_1535264 [Infundibulicybe gibba]|nr:hypothetical protein BD779DRAFT_1535264 [Infundibulicybe gibba]